jgi:hypothetical protein
MQLVENPSPFKSLGSTSHHNAIAASSDTVEHKSQYRKQPEGFVIESAPCNALKKN